MSAVTVRRRPPTVPGMVRRVAVIGAGAWGTTMASHLASRTETVLWAREPEVVANIADEARNETYLPGFDLAPGLRATIDLPEAVAGAEVVIVAVPTQYLRSVAAELSGALDPAAPVISLVKGIEADTYLRPTQILAQALPSHPSDLIGVLSGPNLAREVMAGQPSATVVAMTDDAWASRVQVLIASDSFRVYTNRDVTGCEIGGAVKNVLAIAAGMIDGMGYGWNTRAGLMTRGLAELARLGVALGGDPLTFLGLAGNGDLIATCGSPDSRNHRVGEALASGKTIDEIVGATRSVAEGVRTAPALLELARIHAVEMPIAAQVDTVLRGELTPAEALLELMRRLPRPELHGLL